MHHSDDEKIASWPSKDSNSRIRNKMNCKTNYYLLNEPTFTPFRFSKAGLLFRKYSNDEKNCWLAFKRLQFNNKKQNELKNQLLPVKWIYFYPYSIFQNWIISQIFYLMTKISFGGLKKTSIQESELKLYQLLHIKWTPIQLF